MVKKLFGEINLTWKKVIVSAVLIALYTALMALLPITANTSFRDIAINFEWWILFGILIIVNSRSPLDSALKCFVFFLISQPLIYLFQVPFHEDGFGLFIYYRYWFLWTLLTFPMGYVGYYVKKNNLFSAIILVPMFLLLAFTGLDYFESMCKSFPNHLLSFLSCLAILLTVAFCVLKKNRLRLLSILLTAVLFVALFFALQEPQRVEYEVQKELSEINVTLHGDVDVIRFSGDSDGEVNVIVKEEGNCVLSLKGAVGAEYSFVLRDEENQEFSFEYRYTDENGMELTLAE